MTYAIRLPDGSLVQNIPDEIPPEEAKKRILAAMPELAGPPKESTTIGELVRGTKQLGSSILTGLGSITSPEQAAIAGVERGKKISEEAGEGPSFAAVRKAYQERGLLPAAGEVISQLPRALAGQLPQLATIAGGARLGAIAGSAVAPGAGTIVGGVLGAGAALLPQFMGANVERQAQEQMERGEPVDISRTKAYAGAAGQAAVEGAGTAFVLGKRVVKGILGIADDAALATAKAQQELARAAARSLPAAAGRGALRGTAEIPVEIAQQIIERAQAGLDLTSPEAFAEYGEAAYLAGLVGPTLGGGAGVVETRGARRAQAAPTAPGGELPIEEARRLAAEKAAAEAPPPPPEIPPLPETYAELIQFSEQVKAMPKSKERIEALKAARDKRRAIIAKEIEAGRLNAEAAKQFLTAEEAAAAEITPREELGVPEPTVRGEAPQAGLAENDILALGITKKQPIFKRILGKDMNDPDQRTAVLADIENYLNRGNGTEESRTKLTAFREQFAAPAETFIETPTPAQRENYWRPNPYAPENKSTWQDTFGFIHYDVDYTLPSGGRVKDLVEAAQSNEIQLRFINSKGEEKIIAVYAAKGKTPYWQGTGDMTEANIEAGLGSELYKAIGTKKLETEADYDALFLRLRSILTKSEVPSVPSVSTGPEAGGAGVGVAGEPGTGTAPAGVGITEPTGVVRTEPDVEQPAGGEGAAQPAVASPLVSQEDIDKRLDLLVESGQITEEQAQDYRTEFMEEESAPPTTAMGAALQAQIDEIKAKMDALRQKNGRAPAKKSKNRAAYDALQAQLDTLLPPETGALKERLEQAGATGVFSVRDGKPVLDLSAVRDALKNRDPKMYKAVLTYIGVDEDGNYLPTTYSADEAAQSVGLAKSSGANVRRTAEALGLSADVISRFQASQTGVVDIAKNVSEASLSGISVESPKAGVLYEPPAKPVKTEEEFNALRARVEELKVDGKAPTEKDANYKPYRNAVKALTQATPKIQRFLQGAVDKLGALDFTKLDDRQLADVYSRASRYDAADNIAVMQQLNAEVEARRAADRRGMDAAINRAYGKLVEEEETQTQEEAQEVVQEEGVAPDQVIGEGEEFELPEIEDATARLSDEDVAELGARPTPGVTSPAITQAATSGDTTRTLQAIRQTPDATPLDHAVAQRFLGLGRFLGLPKIEVVPADQVVGDGQYDPETDTVRIAQGQADTHTVLHEVTHGFVHKLIVANERGLRNDEGYRDLKALYQFLLKKRPGLAEEYGFKNLSEFASESMSNPQFQKKLATIEYKTRSAWSTFVDAVRKLLKLVPGKSSALAESFAAVDSLLRVGREYQTKGPSIKAGTAALAPAQVQAQPIGEKEKPGFSGYLERKLGSEKIQGLRTKVADSLAAVDAFFADKYNGRVKDNTGNANPIVLLSRALDSMRFSKIAQEVGTLKRDPEGLIVADKLIAGNEFSLIKGEEVSYLKALQELKRYGLSKEEVGKILIGHREHGLRELVRAQKSNYVQTLTDAQIDAYERRFQSDQRIQRISQMLDAVRFSMIDLMVSTGRIDAAKAAEWKDATGYVPFSRLDKLDNFYDPSVPGKRGAAVYRNMRELSGDPTRRLENPLDTFSGLIDWMSKESMTNEASSRALTEMALFNAAQLVPGRDAVSENQRGAVVDTFINGVKKSFLVPDPSLLGAFVYQTPTTSSVLRGFQQGSRILRAGVTSMPPFVIKQVFDDITRMYAFAGMQNNLQAVGRVLFNFPRIWISDAFGKKSKLMQDMEQRGLVGTFDFTEQGNVKNIMAEAGVEKRSVGSRMLQIMEAGAKASDLAVRNAIYEQVLKETGSKAEAENRAREIINFSRRGNAKIMDTMIRIVPFFNAFARGTDKLLVAASGGRLGVGESIGQPRAMFWKRMTTLTAMATVYALLMSDDDEYNKLPDRVRDRNIIIPFNEEFVRKYGVLPAIPLPADLAFIFKAIPERVIQYHRLYGTPEERSMLEITRELVKQGYDVFSTPNITPQILRPILENIWNYSTFLDRPLESQAQQNLRPFERYGMGTSDVAKRLAAAGEDIAVSTGVEAFAISPIKLENFIRGMLGTIGGTVLAVGDAMINPTRTDRPLQNQLLPQLTGASAVMKDAVGSRFLDEMYRLDRSAEQVYNTYRRLSETDPDKADRFILENYGLYMMRDNIKAIMRSIQEATATASAIDKMPDLSSKDRRDMINTLRRDQALLAKQAYELRRMVNITQMQVDKELR